MSGAIRIFQSLQQIFQIIGLDFIPPQLHRSPPKYSFNARNIVLLIFSAHTFISATVFFLREIQTADTFLVGISFYMSITLLNMIINTSNVAWKMASFLNIILVLEELIERSEFNLSFIDSLAIKFRNIKFENFLYIFHSNVYGNVACHWTTLTNNVHRHLKVHKQMNNFDVCVFFD